MAIGSQPTGPFLCTKLECAGLAVVVASCGSTAETSTSAGQTSIGDGANTAASSPSASETAAPGTAETAARTRLPVEPLVIEESDIVKAAEHRLYVLNQHAGLNVIDTSSPKAPERIARLSELAGPSGELYVRDDALIALVVDSGLGCHALAPEQYRGLPSTAIALVAHPALDPSVAAQRCVPGAVAQSRLVGDRLYVVTGGAPAQPELGFVFSLDVSGADNFDVVDDVKLEGSAFEVHVTDSTLYLAEQRGAATLLRILDISANDGSLTERGSVQVAGTPAGRFHMDARGTEFRIVTRDRDADTSHLYVIDASNPDHPTVEGTLERLAPGEEKPVRGPRRAPEDLGNRHGRQRFERSRPSRVRRAARASDEAARAIESHRGGVEGPPYGPGVPGARAVSGGPLAGAGHVVRRPRQAVLRRASRGQLPRLLLGELELESRSRAIRIGGP